MNQTSLSRPAPEESILEIRIRSESTLLPVTGIDVAGRVVTFVPKRSPTGACLCGNTGKNSIEFVKRSFLISPVKPYFDGICNTGSCPRSRVDVVTFSTNISSRKSSASVALPINSNDVQNSFNKDFRSGHSGGDLCVYGTKQPVCSLSANQFQADCHKSTINLPINKKWVVMSTRTHPKSPYQFIVVRRKDGTQVNVSAKTSNPTVANLMEAHVKLRLEGDEINPMTMNEALEISEGICKAANMKSRTPVPAIVYLRGLIEEHTGSAVYLVQKRRVVDVLEKVLLEGGKERINLWDVSGDDIGKFQAHFGALGRRAYTIRVYTHVLSALLAIAVERNVISENVVEYVNTPPRPQNSPRRPFTHDELNKIFAVADNEWRGMMLVALYTGLRLGDICRLVYRDIDMSTSHIRAAVKKAGAFEAKPVANALKKYFLTLKWPTDLDTPVFPRAYHWAMSGCKSIQQASKAFILLLIKAGVRKEGESALAYNREGGDKYAPLSFHCLRHNCSTMLKLTGVPEAIARKIIGHRSVAISDIYTHLGEDIMLAAVQSVPKVIDTSRREIGTSFAA